MGGCGEGSRMGDAGARFCAVAGCADLGLCRRSRAARRTGGPAMMIAIMSAYLALLAGAVWLGLIRFNTFWKSSPIILLLFLNLALFIPMGWGAPQGPALVF